MSMEQPSPEQASDATGSVAVQLRPQEPPGQLRPPESWPGAGGRKSVAPDVPSWPGVNRSSEPGGSWPGANPRKPRASAPAEPAPPLPLDSEAIARLRQNPPAHRVSRNAKGLWALRAGLFWLVPFLLGCVWVALDPDHRSAELILLGLVAVAAATHILLVPRRRYGIHRWQVTDDAVYTQHGAFVHNRRIVPLADVTEVRTGHGPLEAIFGLGTITVTTATSRMRIAHLSRGPLADVSATIGERAGLAS
ncbi:PH domain-containing protein [Kineosphaera limosa]|uniref:PH domain-containing protein n=2 Tax=Kineosphaera limosa TaxID=111564 RepID=UPI0009FCC6D5|nr:PH domain-containing protein [Kineosphaera limosa]